VALALASIILECRSEMLEIWSSS